ncbi:phosphate transport system protein [Bacilli bacterium PM5-3]|nr:phosphate transport system protein [Bacilli bacterium PM5-3]MDH6603469.1 phosphate transport system protein [Bacilli bacterium PM5-9]
MKFLDDVINSIIESLSEMFDSTIEAQKNAIQSLVQEDNKKAMSVIDGDEAINRLEEQLNYDVMIAIAKYQPVASDLRKLIAIIKVANDLERIGDYAKTISKTAILNCDKTFLNETFLKNSLKMSNIIIDLLEKAKNAFIDGDVDGAYDIIKNENQLQDLLKETISSNPFCLIEDENVESFMLLMGVIRTLERSRGHLANICEAIIFVGNGKFIEL